MNVDCIKYIGCLLIAYRLCASASLYPKQAGVTCGAHLLAGSESMDVSNDPRCELPEGNEIVCALEKHDLSFCLLTKGSQGVQTSMRAFVRYGLGTQYRAVRSTVR